MKKSDKEERANFEDFEKKFSRLQAIVSELESGALSLDTGMKLYEEGMRCSKDCKAMLESARHTLHKWQTSEEDMSFTRGGEPTQDPEIVPF